MANRLCNATSPYLLQHADNPVDWHEWGPEPFELAERLDCPVLLSVGYAACHWCHVMAHESFEDQATADYMNRHFVNIKVDREERPDVDRIYMDAVQAMSGHGGWPMTVFMTPRGEPFFAGTYFPKEPRGHHPSFMQVLHGITKAWSERREEITQQASRLTEAVRARLPSGETADNEAIIRNALSNLGSSFDQTNGGFGGAPKFPQAPTLEFLIRVAALDRDDSPPALAMLTRALDAMAAGGIYDHLSGGFARYSVDAEWTVPHFEKMLYDNALLASLYARAWVLTANRAYRTVATETLDYLIRDMRHPLGGFFSSQDADSEGIEGEFAVWSREEFNRVLGDDASTMAAIYGVTEHGNFEGRNILTRREPLEEVSNHLGIDLAQLEAIRRRGDAALTAARNQRVQPEIDDKVITAWNGLMLRALCDAGIGLGRPDYIECAELLGSFIQEHATDPSGRLVRSWRDGRISGPGFADDYAAVGSGLFALYQATGDETWYRAAIKVTDELMRLFADDAGGFHATGSDVPALIARPKNLMDNPTPSDNSLAAEALSIRAALTGESILNEVVDGIRRAASLLLDRYPMAIGHLLAEVVCQPRRQLAVVPGIGLADLLTSYRSRYLPDLVLAVGNGESAVPLLWDRTAVDGAATAYLCEDFVCRLPTTEPVQLAEFLDGHADNPNYSDPDA